MISGSCFCGGVRFEIEDASYATCACDACRRSHGAPAVEWASVATARFHLKRGDQWLRRYESSPATFWMFCDLCGTSLFHVTARNPGVTRVSAANLAR